MLGFTNTGLKGLKILYVEHFLVQKFTFYIKNVRFFRKPQNLYLFNKNPCKKPLLGVFVERVLRFGFPNAVDIIGKK